MIQRISQEDLYQILETPYNPVPQYNDDYEQEHDSAHESIKAGVLALVGGNAWLGYTERFSMNDDNWTESRFISVSLDDDECFKSNLVPYLQDLLRKLPEDYLLHVGHDTDFYDPFDIFITRECIRGYFENPNDLSKFEMSHSGL